MNRTWVLKRAIRVNWLPLLFIAACKNLGIRFLFQICSDYYFIRGVFDSIQYHINALNPEIKTYFLFFSFEGSLGLLKNVFNAQNLKGMYKLQNNWKIERKLMNGELANGLNYKAVTWDLLLKYTFECIIIKKSRPSASWVNITRIRTRYILLSEWPIASGSQYEYHTRPDNVKLQKNYFIFQNT